MSKKQSALARWVVVCVLAAAPLAASLATEESVAVNGGASFAQRRAAIEKALTSGSRYSEISREDRKQVLEALARIETTLASAGSAADLPAEATAALQQDQTFVNETLARAEADSELRCQTKSSIGSNIRSRQCETKAAKKRREEEEARFGPPRLDVLQ